MKVVMTQLLAELIFGRILTQRIKTTKIQLLFQVKRMRLMVKVNLEI